MKKYTFHISIFALILALSGLGCVLFQNWNKDWDSVMFAVAMLSGLVMILIGWNIYSLIDANNFKEDIKNNIIAISKRQNDTEGNLINEIIRIRAIMFDSVSLPYKKTDAPNEEFLYTFFTLRSINDYFRLGEIDAAIKRADELINSIPRYKPISKDDRLFLLEVIGSMRQTSIKEIEERIHVLNRLVADWDS